ncbi:MAG: hypothetical protein M3461_21160 [Pseudomonadota bacterium]|nr:hypothetical protein [Pseudomonadota bacterium]
MGALVQSLALREIQGVQPQSVALGLVECQARVFVPDHFAKARGDGGKQRLQFEVRDHRVVHFKKQAKVVALVEERLLVALYALIVQRVVHGDRDLIGHLLQEFQIGVIVGGFLQASEAECPQRLLRRGERDHAQGLYALLAQDGGDAREAGLVSYARNH